MLNNDKNSRNRKSSNKEGIVKRTKKSSIAPRTKSNKSDNNKVLNKSSKVAPKKVVSEQPKKKKVKKPRKPLTEKQIKLRNIAIGILTIVIIGGLCVFAVIEYSKQNKAQTIPQQQQETIDGLTDEQLITAANAYLGNLQYNFKSVLSESKASNGDIVATLMATQEQNGVYNTTKVQVTYEITGGEPVATNEQNIAEETNTSSAIEGSTVVQNKLDVTYKVLDYLLSTGMNINDTNWAMDIMQNKTIDGQTGYLIDVYEVQGSVSNLIEWIFVSSNGQMYNAGSTGNGPLEPLQ